MKKNEYGFFHVEGQDYFIIDGKKFKKTKTVYKKSNYEYVLELIDVDYNVVYMIILYGDFTKGPYKSRHHAIKILNELPSYNDFSELINSYFKDGYSYIIAYIEVISIIINRYGCLDAYGLYMINNIFVGVYHVWN